MFGEVFGNRRGCVVVSDVDALERVLNRGPRAPILFTENGRDFIRIWPCAQRRVDDRILGWCRNLVVAFQGTMARDEGQAANAA